MPLGNRSRRKDILQPFRIFYSLGLTYLLVLDPEGAIAKAYGVIGLPTSFVVGRDGRAVAFGAGPHEWGSAPAHALLGALL